jgi:hypothetical protein
VTAEIALGTLGLAVVIFGLIGLFATVIMQIRCVDAAAEIARQASRGDHVAMAQVQDGLPERAKVTAVNTGDVVHVHVDVPMSPWGQWLPSITVSAEAESRREESRT